MHYALWSVQIQNKLLKLWKTHRQLVGLLGCGISPSQRPLGQHKHRKDKAIHTCPQWNLNLWSQCSSSRRQHTFIVRATTVIEMYSTSILYNKLQGAEPSLRSRQLRSYWRIFQHFMEPESSLPSTGVEAGSNTSTVSLLVVGWTEKGTQYLEVINTGTWPSRLGESRIWGSKMWSRVPRHSDLRMTALTRTSSSCKWQTHPLVREYVT
jgi:hypothetical protein